MSKMKDEDIDRFAVQSEQIPRDFIYKKEKEAAEKGANLYDQISGSIWLAWIMIQFFCVAFRMTELGMWADLSWWWVWLPSWALVAIVIAATVIFQLLRLVVPKKVWNAITSKNQ
jgi:hypothetical protein